MKKNIIFIILMILTQHAFGSAIAEGRIPMNGSDLKVVLFDDPAPQQCKKLYDEAKGAMFYLNEKGFGSGCWIVIGNEVHTLITSYDTNQSKSYVFPLAAFNFSNNSLGSSKNNDQKSSASAPSVKKSKISEECKHMYQARVFNYFLENICQFNGDVSTNLGVAAHKLCDNEMDEPTRVQLSDEVKGDIKNDIDSIGQKSFCQRNKNGYESLIK